MRLLATTLRICVPAWLGIGALAAGAQTAHRPQLVVQLGHPHVNSVAISPDGRTLLTGGDDDLARLWDAANGMELRRFAGHSGGVISVAFSPDGRFVLTGSWDNTARLWDAATGKELRRFEGHSQEVNSVAFSPDGRRVLTGSGDNTARLWDAKIGRASCRERV